MWLGMRSRRGSGRRARNSIARGDRVMVMDEERMGGEEMAGR